MKSKPTIISLDSSVAIFFEALMSWHKKFGRHNLPWREDASPYTVWVSEIMLQQTQVCRVVPKFQGFMDAFPNLPELANAAPVDILRLWKGLGYNNRALRMKRAAQEIQAGFSGKIPENPADLKKLTGIGPYTAGAICAFAFNKPSIFIETNIRRVTIHHFFTNQQNVSDKTLTNFLRENFPQDISPKKFYWALMDYGAFLGQTLKSQNPNRRAKFHATQSRFKDSDRQIRGKILAMLLEQPTLTKTSIIDNLSGLFSGPSNRIDTVLLGLAKDGMIIRSTKGYTLPKN